MEEVRTADLVIVAGSSLQVVPVSKVPALVHAGGGDVIVVNNEPTYADEFAAAVFHQDVAQILPRLFRAVLNGAERAK
jgi:NAD-dependent SIR2 family protein deacetylase